jgi:hypothetical protein
MLRQVFEFSRVHKKILIWPLDTFLDMHASKSFFRYFPMFSQKIIISQILSKWVSFLNQTQYKNQNLATF